MKKQKKKKEFSYEKPTLTKFDIGVRGQDGDGGLCNSGSGASFFCNQGPGT